ncbi:MAG: phosphatase PAP2 family protein [Flavobacteriales bacterium]|nr:phosphatase PAP2 family protein [Flavobacteriales bacterium]|tara:strand:+ start:96 stop:668 length:573 start_codon:yes stop_codon:yes gene_type:complete
MIDKIIELDKELFIYLNKSESITDFFWIFITDRKVMFVMLLSLIIYLLYKYESNSYKLTIFLIIITFISTDLIHNHCFKEVFQRLRPCWDPEISEKCRVLVEKGGEYGFVSGHAANFFGIMSIIFFRLPNIKTLIKFIFFIWGLLICYSRIHVGKHYPLDVFFGAILGLILAYLIHKITKLFLSQKKYNY